MEGKGDHVGSVLVENGRDNSRRRFNSGNRYGNWAKMKDEEGYEGWVEWLKGARYFLCDDLWWENVENVQSGKALKAYKKMKAHESKVIQEITAGL